MIPGQPAKSSAFGETEYYGIIYEPLSFRLELPASCWTVVSNNARRTPMEDSLRWSGRIDGDSILTAPRETGGTTASISMVSWGEM